MVTVCQTCGDEGFTNALIFCDECQVYAVHRYCLAVLPETFDEYVVWLCADCESDFSKLSSHGKLDLLEVGGKDSESSESVEVKKINLVKSSSKKSKRRKIFSRKKSKRRKIGTCSLTKSNVPDPTKSSSVHLHGVECTKTNENDQESGRQDKLVDCGSDEAVESIESETSKVCLDVIKPLLEVEKRDLVKSPRKISKKRKIFKSFSKKSKRRKIGNSSLTKSKVPDPAKSSSVQLHGEEFTKAIEKDQESGKQDRLDDCNSNEAVESIQSKNAKLCLDAVQPLEMNCSDDGRKDESHDRRLNSLDEGHVSEEADCIMDKSTLGAIPLEEKLDEIRNDVNEVCVSGETKSSNSLSEHSFHEEAKPLNNNFQIVISYEPNFTEYSSVHAQPIQEPIWRGSFCMSEKNDCIMVGLVAHVSKLACLKVSEEAKSMPTSLSPELLPRLTVWPKGFGKSGPTDESIALYFFPVSDRNEKVFDRLVNDMIQQDLAMRVIVQNAELLVFSSTILPMEFWRFQAKFYLWGVFKGKRPPQETAAVDAIPETERHPLKVLTWDRQSPVSPLSNGSNDFGSVHSSLSSSKSPL
ncbi:uncharacterized protein LOC126675511 [Mercurialis annua]|uniref:uncharacterized protein LOC126675511 n=1 Tax=Mercurialis annua TaxID=3986 RepID=UPI0024AFB496|nr:uncharacterized protein LOC126675511 [Mercurialis annua]